MEKLATAAGASVFVGAVVVFIVVDTSVGVVVGVVVTAKVGVGMVVVIESPPTT